MLWNGKGLACETTTRDIYMCVAVLGRNRTLFCCVFGHVTALQVLKRRSLVKGVAHTCCVDVASNYKFTHCV